MHNRINDQVIEFNRKVVAGQRESAVKDLLQFLCNTLHDEQVWPTTPDQVCGELTAAYNYIHLQVVSSVCNYKLISSCFDESKTNDIIRAVLKRVYKAITGSDHIEENPVENIRLLLLKILKVLENPVFHFKSLTIVGKLLLLVTVISLYEHHIHGSSQEYGSCLLRFTEMAGVPVLKESCHFYHGFLLSSPFSKDVHEKEVKSVVIEDVICLYLATFQHPVNHLDMEHQPWKWLFTAMECRNLMQQRSHTLAMQKLQSVLKSCVDPVHKCRLLSLFAACYFHMDCPQLSIQTYRDALQADSRCYSILYLLSLVYQSLDMPELELESLNLCVMAQGDERKREKDTVPVIDIDELIWSTVPPITPVSYILAKVIFAKRCLQLKRYPEAAEQYSSLVTMLQEDDTFLQFEKHETNQELNIVEILVEAAEVLLITRQFQDCIKLCDNTQPSLSADDAIAKNSQMMDDSQKNISFLENSQSDFFSMESLDLLSSPKKKLNRVTDENDPFADLSTSLEKSRKRMRSCDPLDETTNGSGDDILMVRLLLCKADALVLSEGFTDSAICCLQESMDILLRLPQPSSIKPDQPCNDMSDTNLPHPKRQRISSDGKAVCPQAAENGEACLSNGVRDNAWSRHLMDTALRMATAAWKRKRLSSVVNSCRVVEQLDSGNVDAIYVKTQAMTENCGYQREAIGAWLNNRGITYLVDRKELEKTIQKLEQRIGPCEESALSWWRAGENDFVTLDVKCLKLLLDVHSFNKK